MKTINQLTALSLIALTALAVNLSSQPASAYVTDPTAISMLQNSRKDLLVRESKLMRDQDDLNRQINDLKKSDNDPQVRYAINDLCQKLDSKYAQLQRTRWELKQIEQSLM